jgi:FMN-dependent dehydrogenase
VLEYCFANLPWSRSFHRSLVAPLHKIAQTECLPVQILTCVILSIVVCVHAAKSKLDLAAYEYVASGSEDEQTLAENTAAFKRYMIVPRFMVDVSRIDTSLNILGQQLSMPILVSPAGVHKICHSVSFYHSLAKTVRLRILLLLSSRSILQGLIYDGSLAVQSMLKQCNLCALGPQIRLQWWLRTTYKQINLADSNLNCYHFTL